MISQLQYYWANQGATMKGLIIASGIVGLLVGSGFGSWLGGWRDKKNRMALPVVARTPGAGGHGLGRGYDGARFPAFHGTAPKTGSEAPQKR